MFAAKKNEITVYFDYPLEQGLRLKQGSSVRAEVVYFDYPLEQGLRHHSAQQKLYYLFVF